MWWCIDEDKCHRWLLWISFPKLIPCSIPRTRGGRGDAEDADASFSTLKDAEGYFLVLKHAESSFAWSHLVTVTNSRGVGHWERQEKIGRSGWRNRARNPLPWFSLFSPSPFFALLPFLSKPVLFTGNSFFIPQQTCFGYLKQLFSGKNSSKEDWEIRMEEQGQKCPFLVFPLLPF